MGGGPEETGEPAAAPEGGRSGRKAQLLLAGRIHEVRFRRFVEWIGMPF